VTWLERRRRPLFCERRQETEADTRSRKSRRRGGGNREREKERERERDDRVVENSGETKTATREFSSASPLVSIRVSFLLCGFFLIGRSFISALMRHHHSLASMEKGGGRRRGEGITGSRELELTRLSSFFRQKSLAIHSLSPSFSRFLALALRPSRGRPTRREATARAGGLLWTTIVLLSVDSRGAAGTVTG